MDTDGSRIQIRYRCVELCCIDGTSPRSKYHFFPDLKERKNVQTTECNRKSLRLTATKPKWIETYGIYLAVPKDLFCQ